MPAGPSPEQTHLAGETLGGAVSVAAELPARIGTELLESAHRAFDSGIILTGSVAAVVMVAAAVMAHSLMRPRASAEARLD